ncbi:MAG: molybdate ABC transporter substrate-binding protein [Hyphomicrobiales bacterium]
MNRRLRVRPWWLFAIMAVLVLAAAAAFAACGDDDDDDLSPTPAATTAASSLTSTADPVKGEVVVFAASSLTDAFNDLGNAFEAEYPGTKVTYNFASSSALATQINEGAPADVFASADLAQMKVVTDAGNAGEAKQFATNRPVVVVPKSGSPVAAFEDLAKSGVRLVLAAPEVPIGRYARDILANASASGGISPDFSDRVLANLESNEANVRAVLTKVQLGEADAGIVYSTDAAVAGDDVRVIDVPEAFNVIARYPIAAVTDSENPSGAAAFVAFVLSDGGQAVLKKYGFGSP